MSFDMLSTAKRIAQLCCWCLLALAACTARERFAPDEETDTGFDLGDLGTGHVAIIDLSRGVPETSAAGLFQLSASRTHVGLVRQLASASTDEDVKSVFVRLSQQNYDWAQAEEIGRLLQAVKRTDRRVVCHAHTLSNSTAWMLLRGCDSVWLSPAGEVATVGIAAQMTYLKGALDKLEIEADFLAMGRFKSGGEPITRTGPSEASRENLTEALRSIRATWLESAAAARKAQGIQAALEAGPFVPRDAKARGLIDRIGFESEALALAKKEGNVKRTEVRFGPGRKESEGGLAELVRILAGVDDSAAGADHIAVVPAVGGITMGSSEAFGGEGITADAMLKTLRKLRESKHVKAVVLRIDSPGGSPLASDLIWKELMELRKKVPVIASVGGMAASGGYYIACAADRLIAERTSIVGSIGVFGGKFVIGKALEQVGITSYTFPASDEPGAAARAAYMSPLIPWNEATRRQIAEHMRHIYQLFLERVAKGRDMDRAKVEAQAEGAIFTGVQGKARGLVDEFGGLEDAIEVARRRAKLPADTPVVVEGLQESLIETLFSGSDPAAGDVQLAVTRWQEQQERWRALVPPNLNRFIQSLLPLAQGEHSLAALPFVFVVR